MMMRALMVILVAFAVTACGVKTDLDLPQGGKRDERQQNDPSRPPVPLGQ